MPEDEAAGDRTEEATPRRREREREQGRVAKSRDLGAALSLLGAILLLRYGGHGVAWLFVSLTEETLQARGKMATLPIPYGREIMPVALEAAVWFALTALPLLAGMFLVAAAASYGQVGFLFAPMALEPNLDKINPVSGFKRIFSLRSFITLVMNLAKVALMVIVAWPPIRDEIGAVAELALQSSPEIYRYAVEAVLKLALRLACLLTVLGILDYAYQRHQQNSDMRMTKQQVKEEYKDTEGSPEIRQKRRQLQRQLAQQRMMQEVPKADVVIRNPTHFAVALRYLDDWPAPKVVAKGMDRTALRIIEIAVLHRVLVCAQPALARRLYADVELGEAIPVELYQAVAEFIGQARIRKDPKALRAHREAREARERERLRAMEAADAERRGAPWFGSRAG